VGRVEEPLGTHYVFQKKRALIDPKEASSKRPKNLLAASSSDTELTFQSRVDNIIVFD